MDWFVVFDPGESATASQLPPRAGAAAGRVTAPSLAPGTLINGRYRVREALGRGGMGIVYRVDDLLHPERVLALKTIRREVFSPQRVSRLKSEFKLMAGLRHPNIARVYDFEMLTGSDECFFTMEYVRGASLAAAAAGLPTEHVVEKLVQVCRALAYLHSRQLLHLDLKPSNILVDDEGTARLVDFGLSGDRHAPAIGGTPAYMAPELAAGGPVDARVDLYGLGVTMFELLCRRRPVAHTTSGSAPDAPTGSFAFDEAETQHLPAWLRGIVTRLCALSPSARFPSANAVIEALNRDGGLDYTLETEDHVRSSRFVGRDAEREELLSFVSGRVASSPGTGEPLFAVLGPSGIGKSRLVREVKHQVQLSGVLFVEGNCYEGGFSEYGPLSDAVSHLTRALDAAGHRDLLELYQPELARLLPSLARTSEAPRHGDASEAERFHFIDRLSELLVRAAERVPFVLYLNDLQWARPAVTDVLLHLIHTMAEHEPAKSGVTLAILVSCRDDEIADRPARRLFERLSERKRMRRARLAPLQRPDIEAIVASMLGLEAVTSSLVARVAERTSGVPFLVEELMRVLVAGDGSSPSDSGGADDLERLDLSLRMSELLLRRVDRLAAPVRELLRLISVSGSPTPVRILQRAAALDEDGLYRAVAELERRHLVSDVAAEELTYATVHDYVRETVYASIAPPERALLHGRLAEALERDEHPERHGFALAHHYWRAGSGHEAAALRCALAGGDRARADHANHLAIELFERALTLLPEADLARRDTVREKLGNLRTLIGDYRSAQTLFEALLERCPTPLDRARVLRKLGNLHAIANRPRAATDHLWSAARLLGDDVPRTRARRILALLAALGVHVAHRCLPFLTLPTRNADDDKRRRELATTYLALSNNYWFFDPLGCILCCLRAANHAERTASVVKRCLAHTMLAMTYPLLALHGGALHYARRALADARRTRSPFFIALGSLYLGVARHSRGSWKEAAASLQDAIAELRRYGDVTQLANAYIYLFTSWESLGDFRRAGADARAALDVMERTGNVRFVNSFTVFRASAMATLGDLEPTGAALALRKVAEEADPTFEAIFPAFARMHLGQVLRLAGDLAGAQEELAAAIELRERAVLLFEPIMAVYSHAALTAIERAAALDGPERARQLDLARRYADQARRVARRRPSQRAGALCVQALCLWHAGQRRRARRVFARALRLAHRQGARFWLAQILLALAQSEQGHEELAAATRHRRLAVEIFETCGARAWAVRAQHDPVRS